MLSVCLDIAMVICAINFLAFLFRVLRGPAVADRAVAMDSCGIAVMALIVIYSMRQGTDFVYVLRAGDCNFGAALLVWLR